MSVAWVSLDPPTIPETEGIANEATMPMIAMTTSSSSSEKPAVLLMA